MVSDRDDLKKKIENLTCRRRDFVLKNGAQSLNVKKIYLKNMEKNPDRNLPVFNALLAA